MPVELLCTSLVTKAFITDTRNHRSRHLITCLALLNHLNSEQHINSDTEENNSVVVAAANNSQNNKMSLSSTTTSWFEFVYTECLQLVRELQSFQETHPAPYAALSRVLGSITIGGSTYNVIDLAERIAGRQIILSKLEYVQVGHHMVSHLASIYRAISYFGSTIPPQSSSSSSSSASSTTSSPLDNSTFTETSPEETESDANSSNEKCS